MHGIPAQRNDKEIVIVLCAPHTFTLLIHTHTLINAHTGLSEQWPVFISSIEAKIITSLLLIWERNVGGEKM